MVDEQKNELKKLRFTDDGEMYPEWEENTVKDVFEISRGKVIAKSKVSNNKTEEKPYPIYSSQTLNNGVMGYKEDYMIDGERITWTTDGANAGKVSLRNGKFNCTNVCGILKPKEGYEGAANLATVNLLDLRTEVNVVRNGNPKLMSNIVSEILFPLPSLPEQIKIAELLSKIDEKIEAQTKLIELRKKEKQGYMQRILGGGGNIGA